MRIVPWCAIKRPSAHDLAVFLRSLVAGGAATAVDLSVLFAGVALFHLSPRIASLPALVAGGVANFYGNRHFAFRASSGSLGRQGALYAITEIIALAMNGILYDGVVSHVHPGGVLALAIRLVTTNVVFVMWSYPVWRRVFHAPTA